MQKNDQLTQELAELDLDMERLKTLYEQYFIGVEPKEPQDLRKKVADYFRRSEIKRAKNTALIFRFRSLSAKFVSYVAYWDRVLRLIEEGSFRRDRFRNPMASHPVSQRRVQRLGVAPKDRDEETPTPPATATPSADAPTRPGDPTAAGPAAPSPLRATRDPAVPPPVPRATPDLPARMRRLYDDYVAAKSANGESVQGIAYEAFERSVLKTRAAHLAQFKCDDLDYKVKVANGKVSLVAQPGSGRGGGSTTS